MKQLPVPVKTLPEPVAPVKFFYTLVYLRKRAKLTQKELANALGVSLQSIVFWETGRRSPSPESLQKIADYFEVDLEFLDYQSPTVEIALQIVGEQVESINKKKIDNVTDKERIFLLNVIKTLRPQIFTEEVVERTTTDSGEEVRQRAIKRLQQYRREREEQGL